MRKIFISAILLFAVFSAKAQNEIYKTAQWRYYLKSYDFKEDWFVEMTYNKDTVQYGETWQQFKIFMKIENWAGSTFTYYNKTLYTHLQWNGNKVYYLPPYDSTKYLLLDFDAQPGDSWVFGPHVPITSSCADSNIFYVDSIGTDLISGKQVDWIKGHNNPKSTLLLDTVKIYKNIGMRFNFFTPLYNGKCMSDVNGLRLICYQDTFIGNYVLDSILCNKYDVLSLEEREQSLFNIYPNPVSNTLIIQNINRQNFTGILTDLNGKVLKEEWVTEGLTSWDVSAFAEGLYILTLTKDGEVPYSQKIIIQ